MTSVSRSYIIRICEHRICTSTSGAPHSRRIWNHVPNERRSMRLSQAGCPPPVGDVGDVGADPVEARPVEAVFTAGFGLAWGIFLTALPPALAFDLFCLLLSFCTSLFFAMKTNGSEEFLADRSSHAM